MRASSLAAVAAGLWTGCLLPGPWWLSLCGAVLLVAAARCARRRPRPAGALALLAMVLIGAGLAGGRLGLAERGPLSGLARSGGVAEIAATVATEPRPAAHGMWTVVRVTAVDGSPARQRALLHIDDDWEPVALGQRLSLRASARPLASDGFDGHLRRLGAAAALSPMAQPRAVGEPAAVIAASTRMRDRAREAFGRRLDAERAVLLTGLTTGDVRGRPEGQRERFAAAGLSHLVVVSGKHTALMLAGVLGLCGLAGIGARQRRLVAMAALGWFVVLVRWQPSVLRAAAMAGLVLLAGLLGRGRVGGRMLWAAVLLLLLADPLLAGRLGFVLSVLATAGVLLLAPRLAERLPGPRWWRWTLAATLGAQVGVAPVLFATEGGVPPGALPANLVAGPAAAGAQALGLAAGAVAQVSTDVAGWVAAMAGPLLSAVLWAAERFADLPLLRPRDLLSPAVALAAAAAALWWRRRPRAAVAVAALAAVVVVAGLWRGPVPADALRVTALDVGQGDALLVEAPAGDGDATARLLFDGGPEPRQTLRLLRQRRIRQLDVVVLSHGHADHAGGLPAVLTSLDVGTLLIGALPDEDEGWAAREVVGAAAEHEVDVRQVAEGARFRLGEAQVSVLAPVSSPPAGGDLNENSVVLRVDGAHGALLLTGDVESGAQRRLLRRPGRLDVDVLQVPHHGAGTSIGEFLGRTAPRVALISVGEGNEYGHPHRDVLAELRGATVLRTDRHGTVTVTLGPDGPRVRHRRAPRRSPVRRTPPAGRCAATARPRRRRPRRTRPRQRSPGPTTAPRLASTIPRRSPPVAGPRR